MVFPDEPKVDAAVFPEEFECFFLITAHQGGVSDDVGKHDGC